MKDLGREVRSGRDYGSDRVLEIWGDRTTAKVSGLRRDWGRKSQVVEYWATRPTGADLPVS